MQQEVEFNPENHFTYLRAAEALDRSIESIQKAVSAGVLHPVRFPPANTRYIQRDEIEWFRDKPLTPAIAAAFQQLKETRKELEELKNWIQEDSASTSKLLLAVAVIGIGLGLFASSKKENAPKSVHSAFIESMKELESREDYPTVVRELGNTLLDLSRKEELTFSERRLISELWKVLAMPGEEVRELVS